MAHFVFAATLQLIVLHQPGGRDVVINTAQITTLYAAIPGTSNRLVAQGARCLVLLTDGKHVGVVETCAAVRKLIEGK